MEHHKISKLFNDSTVSKSLTRRWIEVNDLSDGQYFWRSPCLPLINCEIDLDFTWSKISLTSEISRTPKVVEDDPMDATQTEGATFKINKTKLYVLVVTLPINDNIKFLENVKQGFKRTISWNKYWSEITALSKNNNLDYMINPAFRNINRLFVLSFKNPDNDLGREHYSKYYIPLIETEYFIVLINNHFLINT